MLKRLFSNPLIKKLLAFSFGTWIAFLFGFISTPIITRLFMPEEMGKASMFDLAMNIIAIFVIFGTDQAYVRFYYQEESNNRKHLLKKVLFLPSLIFIVFSIIILCFPDYITRKLFNEPIQNISVLLIAGILLTVVHRFAILVIRMQQKGVIFSYLQILVKVISIVTIIGLYLFMGNGAKVLIFAEIIALMIVCLCALNFSKEEWRFTIKKADTKNSFSDILKFSSPLLFTTMIMWLFQSFDRLAIKQFCSYEELGIYVAAFRIIAVLNIFQTSFTTFWTPVAYEHYEKDPDNKTIFERTHAYVALGMISLGIVSIMCKDIITLLVGKSYREASSVMPFLIFIPVMYTISETTVLGINFFKKVKWTLIISIIVCVTNVIGNFLLVPHFQGKGAAISTGISYVLFFMLRTSIARRYYKFNISGYKLFASILILTGYAMLNTFISLDFRLNILFGTLFLAAIGVIYFDIIKQLLAPERVPLAGESQSVS